MHGSEPRSAKLGQLLGLNGNSPVPASGNRLQLLRTLRRVLNCLCSSHRPSRNLGSAVRLQALLQGRQKARRRRCKTTAHRVL